MLSLPRYPLAHLPTPLEFLPRLSRELGVRLWVKRDDLTGLAGGGNKTRKLEYLLAEAQAQGADTLVTVGAVQSNHCRQTAAAAARAGLRCVLVLRGQPPAAVNGNLLLDRLLGAELRWTGNRPRDEVFAEVVAAERDAGRRVYAIPLGGSTALGAAAYAAAMLELAQQQQAQHVAFDRVVFASSSGGTQAGLVVGASLRAARGTQAFTGELLGISVDLAEAELKALVADLATATATLLGMPRVYSPVGIHVNADYLGEGYAVMGEPEREAIELFARCEGLLLDPVYTGRAAAGLLDLIRRGVIGRDETVLFWHTGGQPALFAYNRQLVA
ncbi:MAG: D-cysteine desulfhydrase family protein [Anaerolineales bacterium]|nr:D-cysteine desulfhydrase family protein [Anaerolineales bacterium]